MKTLILSLALISPFSAQAETLITCKALGQGAFGRDLTLTIASPEGILEPDAHLTIAAKGLRFTSFGAQASGALEKTEGRIALPIVTLNASGLPDDQSVEARLELSLSGEALAGEGKLLLTKIPEMQFSLSPEYTLSGCRGEL